jgi:hypothetical protein
MRPCEPHAVTSSKDEVRTTQENFDESSDMTDTIANMSALVRSAEKANVLRGVEGLLPLLDCGLDEPSRRETAFLLVLALYRLGMDKECIAEGKKASQGGYSSPQIESILQTLASEKSGKVETIALGVGAGLLGLGAILSAVFLGRKHRH